MRAALPIVASAAALLLQCGSAFAKGEMVRIIIRGGDLAGPVEIKDPAALARFHAGHGIGNFEVVNGHHVPRYQPQSFIVDWARGSVRYKVATKIYNVVFVMKLADRDATYAVRYAVDPSSGRGYVYIPGEGDPEYGDNIRLIQRGVEGSWFHAWSAWDEMVRPFIAGQG